MPRFRLIRKKMPRTSRRRLKRRCNSAAARFFVLPPKRMATSRRVSVLLLSKLENVEVRVRLGNYARPVRFQRIGNEVGAELKIPLEKRNDPGIEAIEIIDE